VAHHRFELAGIGLDITGRGLVVLALGQIEELSGIGDAFGGPINFSDVRGQPRPLPSELLSTFLVRPDGGVLQLAPYLLEAFFLGVVLKETPVRSRFAPRDL